MSPDLAARAGFDRAAELDEAVRSACDRIAPAWPLDRFIAVNPLWGYIDKPFTQVGQIVAELGGIRLLMPSDYYENLWRTGEITPQDVSAAISEWKASDRCETWLLPPTGEDFPKGWPLASELADRRRDLTREPAFANVVLQQISEFCAGYFDQWQADWKPCRPQGLYQAWRETLVTDVGLRRLLGLSGLQVRARALPEDADDVIASVMIDLDPPNGREIDYLTALLLRVNGWASWCAYLRWRAQRQGEDDRCLQDLLAIRLAWEWLLDDERRDSASVWAQWQRVWAAPGLGHVSQHRWVWQRALEVAYQRKLVKRLVSHPASEENDASSRPAIQAAFCIDVRSEIFRRALEAAMPEVETIGCAGFFGVPLAYTPLGTEASRPHLPALFEPTIDVTETLGSTTADAAFVARQTARLSRRNARKWFARLPASAFTLVETLGFTYLPKLLARSLPVGRRSTRVPRPRKEFKLTMGGKAVGTNERIRVAEKALRSMGLTERFACLIAFVGHASESANNPHASSLDCGACGGQSGEVNARVLAALLNDPDIRLGLAKRGITIPARTHFLAALHNTTLDTVTVFDTDATSFEYREDLERLITACKVAGERVRAERAPSLGLGNLSNRPRTLLSRLHQRASDWSQTRPEWGLTNNAAFIAAPRRLTRGIDLEGRVFLHDYHWQDDTDAQTLEQIMTGPMIVAHWINMQYFASMVDNDVYGSGNKLLHNVVGGRLGVFEGNGGDLRIGLPIQSLHDGQNWRHTPVRLSVFLGAPSGVIDQVLARHETVRHLVKNQWLFLFRVDPEEGNIEAHMGDIWMPVDTRSTKNLFQMRQ